MTSLSIYLSAFISLCRRRNCHRLPTFRDQLRLISTSQILKVTNGSRQGKLAIFFTWFNEYRFNKIRCWSLYLCKAWKLNLVVTIKSTFVKSFKIHIESELFCVDFAKDTKKVIKKSKLANAYCVLCSMCSSDTCRRKNPNCSN